jgi:hypothetical protein
MVRSAIAVLGLFLVIIQCSKQDNRSLLAGTWRTDSVYSYYNGFGFTQHDAPEEPLHRYDLDGSLTMILRNESRNFLYTMPAHDSLIHLTPENQILGKFQILKLSHKFMALKRLKKTVFTSDRQERYEIRYFSRAE